MRASYAILAAAQLSYACVRCNNGDNNDRAGSAVAEPGPATRGHRNSDAGCQPRKLRAGAQNKP
jgi:hypothetical protein